MKRYRYRWKTAEKRLDTILEKIGPVRSVQGYRYIGRYKTDHEAVMVRGQKGSVRISNLLWGFSAEATRATVELLVRLGIHKERAEGIVYNSPRAWPDLGIDWFIAFLPSSKLLVLNRRQIEELAQDPTTARLLGLPRPSHATSGSAISST